MHKMRFGIYCGKACIGRTMLREAGAKHVVESEYALVLRNREREIGLVCEVSIDGRFVDLGLGGDVI